RNAADDDRLPVSRPNSFQPTVIRNRKRHTGRRRRCECRNVDTRVVRQKQIPRLVVIAACYPGARRQLQSKELMLRAEPAPMNDAILVEDDALGFEYERSGTARPAIEALI